MSQDAVTRREPHGSRKKAPQKKGECGRDPAAARSRQLLPRTRTALSRRAALKQASSSRTHGSCPTCTMLSNSTPLWIYRSAAHETLIWWWHALNSFSTRRNPPTHANANPSAPLSLSTSVGERTRTRTSAPSGLASAPHLLCCRDRVRTCNNCTKHAATCIEDLFTSPVRCGVSEVRRLPSCFALTRRRKLTLFTFCRRRTRSAAGLCEKRFS